MKSRIKRFVAFVFSAVLCFSLFVVPAFAAESNLVPIDVGAWTLCQFIGPNGEVTDNKRYAATSSFIEAKYESYTYTGELVDSNGKALYCYIAEYDIDKNFLCRSQMNNSTEAYEITVSAECVYIKYTFGRAPTSTIAITADDLNYFAVCGSGVKTDKNFVSILNGIGEVLATALEWVVLTISTITANNILMLFCVALPLCGLGVGMFSRLIRARG